MATSLKPSRGMQRQLRQWQISFWDATVIAAATSSGSKVLWTEDLQHGREYGSVTVLNPFARTSARP
jgi:predicted nucleic acid-binding protein